jgi:hypothetical protein
LYQLPIVESAFSHRLITAVVSHHPRTNSAVEA